MTPADFLADVAYPNMQAALEQPDDVRAIVNAVLTLDALPGLIHASGGAAGHKTDDKYRDALATISPSYRVVRDLAASFKHGELTGSKMRLVRRGSAVQSVPNGLGLFQAGDHLQSEVVVIDFDPGPGSVRASNVIADSFRMLRRIVEGEPARRDEHEGGTFAIMGGPP